MSSDQLINTPQYHPIQHPSIETTLDHHQPSSPTPHSASIRTRFRTGVQAITAAHRVVSNLHRTTTTQSIPNSISSTTRPNPDRYHYRWRSNQTGAFEPGVNPNRPQPQFAHLSNRPVSIDLVDYSDDKVRFQSFHSSSPSDLERLRSAISAQSDHQSSDHSRPPWSCVRWINVNGLSWEVIKLLAIRYQLHPLAVEDCLHTSARSKSEYYRQHLFVHAAVHTLEEEPHQTNEASDSINHPLPPTQSFSRYKDSIDHQDEDRHSLEQGIIDPEINPFDSSLNYSESNDYQSQGGTTIHPTMDLGTATTGDGFLGKT